MRQMLCRRLSGKMSTERAGPYHHILSRVVGGEGGATVRVFRSRRRRWRRNGEQKGRGRDWATGRELKTQI